MTPDELVEKVARVLVSPKADPSDWRFWTDEARAAIAVALEEAAKVADRAVVPMCETSADRIAAAIRAMIAEPSE